VIATISAAYQQYKLQNTPTAATKSSDLLPYISYIKLDTSTVIDHVPGLTSFACSTTNPCVRLHNGGILLFADYSPFGGTTSNHAISFDFDPDGVYSGSTQDSASKSIQFQVYFDGFTTTRGQAKVNSATFSYPSFGPAPAYDPSWFAGIKGVKI
jgi:hypothetical protein